MGYRCPVCADPQADDVHLANHLAFTALTRGGEHEAWLDEHVPDWGQLDDDGLAEEVTALADEAEYPRMFEDTTDSDHDQRHGDGHDHSEELPRGTDIPQGVGDLPDADSAEEVQEIIEEAREMTRQRRSNTGDDDESEDHSEDRAEDEAGDDA